MVKTKTCVFISGAGSNFFALLKDQTIIIFQSKLIW